MKQKHDHSHLRDSLTFSHNAELPYDASDDPVLQNVIQELQHLTTTCNGGEPRNTAKPRTLAGAGPPGLPADKWKPMYVSLFLRPVRVHLRDV